MFQKSFNAYYFPKLKNVSNLILIEVSTCLSGAQFLHSFKSNKMESKIFIFQKSIYLLKQKGIIFFDLNCSHFTIIIPNAKQVLNKWQWPMIK